MVSIKLGDRVYSAEAKHITDVGNIIKLLEIGAHPKEKDILG